MNKLVSKAQYAFVEGTQILDAFLVANEIIDSIVKKKDSGVLCKLDVEKAYDHINWSFLLKVLQKMGFGIKWVKWIRWCISTLSFSILVNGSSTSFSKSSRVLDRGTLCPLTFSSWGWKLSLSSLIKLSVGVISQVTLLKGGMVQR